ncbi:multidrug transporter AcrB [Marinobacterium zhoushanense]|uniref:Multidrug transporter AcrB n=1 Tax=Marinobacterium zhoushanense TaxID=1679163 RepID=A0ABQ1KMF1_9GAMM|nr:efflux RND transporter permease subunit [Marinobacterium zhoushanense]GGC00764.1 multidrug transporter AcrB [Marinobacterium zhoushanense]
MNITAGAIGNSRLTWVLVLCIVLAGIDTFLKMPRAYDPGFIIRAAQITTQFPGASPERVEQLITSPIEDVVKEIPELDFVKSESRTGVSIVTVNISESYKDMRPIWDELRRKVDDIRSDMPDGVVGPSVNDEFGDVFGIVMSITGEGFSYAEVERVAEQVRDRLLRIPDAAKVEIYGDQEERIFVEFDNARLSELGISPNQLSQALATRNIVIPGGSFALGNERIALEPSGNFETVEDIRKTILSIPGSENLLYLDDIAEVSRGYVDPAQALVHSSGTPALALGIAMREGGNNILLGEQVRAALDELQPNYPYGIEFDLVNFVPDEVDQKVRDFVVNLLQAVAIVTLVMLISLGLRTGLVVASLIPLAMLLAIIVMSVLGIGLDQISLAALIIALGMLVDNGIVMSESIMVQMETGKRALAAAVDSAAELKIPLLTASLTTAAAFLPIYLAESNVGEFTASLFKVVTITLLSSWVISLTVIPMLCVHFMKVAPRSEAFDSGLYGIYRRALLALLRHRFITLAVTLVVFAVAMLGFRYLPNLFFPPSDRLYFKVELELPEGTAIERTEQVVSELERYMQREWVVSDSRASGVTNWVSYVGNAGPKFILSHNPKPSNPSYALMIVNVSDLALVDPAMDGVRAYAFEHFPDLRLKTRRIENGPSVENPVEVRLSGQDSASLFNAVKALKVRMAEIGGLDAISDDWGQRIKKLEIRIDQPRALRAGVTSQDIAISLQAGLSGLEMTEYREGEDSIPVILRSHASNQQDIGKVEGLSVFVQSTGQSVPLTQVANLAVVWEAARIFRRDGVRTVTLGAQLQPGVTAAEKFAQLKPWLDQQKDSWGTRVRYEFGGESESSAKANQSIIDKLPVAALIIVLVLVAQFNSIRKSFIILTTVPLGLIGVVAGLLLGHSFFGFMTFLGIISLAGIVINNAIVLLERIKIELDSGVEPQVAIVSAAMQRARPILLTTSTTVLGLLPLYLGGGEMWEPMTIAIMAGLLFSTLLTLGVVPVLYALIYGIRYSKAG